MIPPTPHSGPRPHVVDRVRAEELVRLLGIRGGGARAAAACERLRPALREARDWYRTHGRHALVTRRASVRLAGSSLVVVTPEGPAVTGTTWRSRALHGRLRRAGCAELLVVGATAGPEVEAEAERSWSDRPDRAWLLERLAAAVVEHLVAEAAADARSLPPFAPGYAGWDLAQQGLLLDVLRDARGRLPGALRLTDGGMLFPKNSLLAVLGLGAGPRGSTRTAGATACACALEPCGFRRSG